MTSAWKGRLRNQDAPGKLRVDQEGRVVHVEVQVSVQEPRTNRAHVRLSRYHANSVGDVLNPMFADEPPSIEKTAAQVQ